MCPLIFATRNAHKTREMGQILGPDFALEDLRAHPEIGAAVEDGATFLENARLKALTISRQLGGLVLADDSGLEVDSLGGAPGIFSARFAGEGVSDESNRGKLRAELALLPAGTSRAARFRCSLVLARAGEVVASFEGSVEGIILEEERGGGGFGYDPLFQPDGSARSFAELSPAKKNAISHRARAAEKLRTFLQATDRSPR
ncbi:MAG: RdgB/HAM1 family non-canonical purine NTP pyrophosphatase [Spartobacteria bacterium]